MELAALAIGLLATRVGGGPMRAGVAIDGMNAVRKHLSRIKGGRLARAGQRAAHGLLRPAALLAG